MPSTSSLLAALKHDYPHITFLKGATFRWSPHNTTIYYANTTDDAPLLHEVAHALLGHDQYGHDVTLLKMERNAWDYVTTTLAKTYDISISSEYIETMLDTYRDWLHDRSLCPRCQATGIQTDTHTYMCPACEGKWRVNEARSCALRRYRLQQK